MEDVLMSFEQKKGTPCVNEQGLSNAKFRIEFASKLCIR